MQVINENTINDNMLLEKLKGKYEVYEVDDFRIIYFHLNEGLKREKFYHKHPDYEFIILLTTVKEILFEDKRYVGETDTIYPISPNKLHGIDVDISSSLSYLDIHVKKDYFNTVLQKIGFPENSEFNYEFHYNKKIALYIDRFMRVHKSTNVFKSVVLNCLKTVICAELALLGLENKVETNKKDFVKKEKFIGIANYIATNYNEPNVVEDIAKLYNYTVASLSKLFSKYYHIPINQFILKVKLSNAKMLLKYSELSIDDIAKECGFKGTKYFSEIFTKKNKISPTKYRKSFDIKYDTKNNNESKSQKFNINDELIIYNEIYCQKNSIIYTDEKYSYFMIPLSLIRVNNRILMPRNLYYFEANQEQKMEHIKNSSFYVLALKKEIIKEYVNNFDINIFDINFVDNTFLNYIESVTSEINEAFKKGMNNTLYNLIKNEIIYTYLEKPDLYYEELNKIAFFVGMR